MRKEVKTRFGYFLFFVLILSLGLYVGYSQKNKIDNIVHPNANQGYDIFDTTKDKDKTNDDVSNSRRNAITRTVALVSPAVVGINVTEIRTYREYDDPFMQYFFGDRRYQQKVQSLGSGFLISSDGYILTNDHVAGNAAKIVVTMTNGEKYDAKLIGSDVVTDVALLKIEGKNLPYIKMGNSDEVLIGEWAIAFGNPFGLFEINDKPTVTVGVISNINVTLDRVDEKRVYKNLLQTDAAINTGNSGGPLVNSVGEVIGMNTIIYSPNQGSVGLGFAIPINKVRNILKELKDHGKVEREFWTGLEIQGINAGIARYYGLKKSEGVIITDVAKNSPGDKVELKPGDIITDINGTKIIDENTVFDLIKDAKAGDVLNLKVFRNDRTTDIALKLEKKK
jgi:serine protease Do